MSQALPKGRQNPDSEASAPATRPRAVDRSGDPTVHPPVDAAPRSFLRMVSHEMRTP